MENLIILMRILFLSVSFWGYIQFVSKYIRRELAVGFVFCSIGSMMFFAGILNVLVLAAWGIAFTGVGLACFSLYRREPLPRCSSWGTVFFLIGSLFFLFLLYGSKFTHYDNFSHWALPPRIMIQYHRFPNLSDPYYKFQSYPLGSSVFIYYFAEITGVSSEWFQMFAQAILLLGLVAGVFVFTAKFSSAMLAAICSVMLLCSNIAFTDLMVDTLLPLIGLSGILFCLYYKDSMIKMLPFTIPYSVFLISVKNSGIFFVAVIIALAWYYTTSDKTRFVYRAGVLLSPFITLMMWTLHVKRVFPQGLASKHSLSLSNFETVFQDKQLEDVLTIITSILRRTFTLSNAALLLIFMAAILWLFRKHICTPAGTVLPDLLCLTLVSYLVYQLGTIGMYIFSMPQDEAVMLAGYERYHQTILTFLSGLVLTGFLLTVENIPANQCRALSLSLLCSILLFWALNPALDFLCRQDLTGSDRQRFDAFFEEYHVLPYCRYAIIVSKDRTDYGYLHYLSRYREETQEREIITDNNLETSDWCIFDYILFFEETDATRTFLKIHFPEVTGPVVDLNKYR